jgi:GNAT superfamily N-acetyltransferase
VGKHLADLLRGNRFEEWESVFVAMSDNDIIGYCTFLRTDYYPDNKYFPWISSIFVDEKYRGNRVSQKIIEAVIQYAKEQHFTRVYIPSDMIGFYEKYGFTKIDELVNYGGDVDNIFAKDI